MIICLGQKLLFGSGELLLTEIQDEINPNFCFILAPNKDLAVSLQYFYWNRQALNKFNARRLVPFGTRRLCSHLAPCGGRLLAATFLPSTQRIECYGGVRTFLPLFE